MIVLQVSNVLYDFVSVACATAGAFYKLYTVRCMNITVGNLVELGDFCLNAGIGTRQSLASFLDTRTCSYHS